MTKAPARGGVRRLQMRIGPREAGRRLDEVAGEWLAGQFGHGLSRSAVRRLIMAGAISVGGRRSRRPGLPLALGNLLEALVRPDALERERRPVAGPPAVLRILYEDDFLLAVDKPPGLPTVPTADPRREHLVGLVKEMLVRRAGAARPGEGEPYLGIHQRLDRDTSGIVLFTRDPAANKGLAEAFATHTVQKTYRALTRRSRSVPKGPWTVEDRLAPAGRGRGPRMASVAVGGQNARTDFEILEAFPAGLLVEARPRTGRKHQIRVHLAEAGLPILGDLLYGGAEAGAGAPRAMLHAARLAFVHPLTGREVVIDCPDPADFQQLFGGRSSMSKSMSRSKTRSKTRRPGT